MFIYSVIYSIAQQRITFIVHIFYRVHYRQFANKRK